MRRLRALTEAECWARCYGAGDENVRLVRIDGRRPRPRPSRLAPEDVRHLFAGTSAVAQPEAA